MPAYALLMFDNFIDGDESPRPIAGESSMRVYDNLDSLLHDLLLNLEVMHMECMEPGFEIRDSRGWCAHNSNTWIERRSVHHSGGKLDISKRQLKVYDNIAVRIATVLANVTDKLPKPVF